jgi:ribosomal protein S1
VQRILDNGIEVGFLGGFSGSVFVDHLDRAEPTKYKLGEKLNARIVTVDPASQLITLSLQNHLVNLENVHSKLLEQGITVGKVFENVPVN